MIKILALVIVATMVVTMSGCSKNEANITDQSVNNASVTEVVNEIEDSIVEDSNESTSSTENSTVESTTKQTETTTVESTTKTKETTTAKPTTTQKETTTAKPTTAHTHNWNPVYKTVHHDAEYKEEKTIKSYTVTHETSRFKDENRTTFDPYDYGYNLSAYNNAVNAFQIYCMDNDIESSYSCPAVSHTISAEVYNTHKNVFYTADPCEYNTVKTLVKDAYDEKVVDYYKCDCGATK